MTAIVMVQWLSASAPSYLISAGCSGSRPVKANRRQVDLVLVHGCSSFPTLTSLKPSVRLRDRQAHWLKRLGMIAEIAEELLDPARDIDISVHRGNGVQALVEASALASVVVMQHRRSSRSPHVRTGSTCARVAMAARAPVAVLSTGRRRRRRTGANSVRHIKLWWTMSVPGPADIRRCRSDAGSLRSRPPRVCFWRPPAVSY